MQIIIRWKVARYKLIKHCLFILHAVGVQKARKIAGSFNLPIVGVHHMEAHALVAR